eukprot:gnl/MRDRNA2_/MRDRNA2_88306_c0_seq1.p1 gnl/MRDRNA2_/MRDRNA2_88306_c0~~gnl/MRDRNA2_/MRDRNA2_88306_c0_seq1.p1  ORF type:complete len:324 (-),score=114.28 gnl/MRDRNA2_/MRDRNA2_88306_c0_seq1:35-1006(-)
MGSDRVVTVEEGKEKDRSTRDRRRERDTEGSNGRARDTDAKEVVEVIDGPAGDSATGSEAAANGETKKKETKTEDKKSTTEKKDKLKPPPAGKAADKTVKTSLSDDAVTQVAQAKFDAAEQNLQAVAKLTMAIARDYPKLHGDKTKMSEKFKEIKLAFLKYRRQLRVWKMQEQVSKMNVKRLEKTKETYLADSETLFAKRAGLREELDEARVKRQRLETHEKIAKEINQVKSCAESQAELEAAKEEVAEVQKDRVQLEATIEGQMKKAQLLMHAILDLKLELQRDPLAAGSDEASGGDGDGNTDVPVSVAADLDGKVVAEVIC